MRVTHSRAGGNKKLRDTHMQTTSLALQKCCCVILSSWLPQTCCKFIILNLHTLKRNNQKCQCFLYRSEIEVLICVLLSRRMREILWIWKVPLEFPPQRRPLRRTHSGKCSTFQAFYLVESPDSYIIIQICNKMFCYGLTIFWEIFLTSSQNVENISHNTASPTKHDYGSEWCYGKSGILFFCKINNWAHIYKIILLSDCYMPLIK